MEITEMNLSEVVERLAALETEVREMTEVEAVEKATEEKKALLERKAELEALETRKAQAEALNNGEAQPDKIIEVRKEEKKMSVIEERANKFVADKRTNMEVRQLLASGVLTPTAVKETIGELPEVVSSIIDDVNVISVEGNGSYAFSFRLTDAEAAAVTDGSAITGTPGSFSKNGLINPATWGILDEISNQVAQKTPIQYMNSIQNNAYVALRRKVKVELTKAVYGSAQNESVTSLALDENFLRSLVLGYDADESVNGATKLYICKEDLATLGKVRGTQDKKPVYEITYTDANNGIIKDGGLAVSFSINSTLKGIVDGSANAQLYGDPKTVTLALWGAYEVSTDEGGDYFKRNMIGIRGLQTAGADITVKNGMQVVTQ